MVSLASEVAFRRSKDYDLDDTIRDLQEYIKAVDKKFASVDLAIAAIGAASVPWTPTLSFDVPGDTNVVLDGATTVARVGRIGKFVSLTGFINATTFTHTTASGSLVIGKGSLPYPIGQRGAGAISVTGLNFPAGTEYMIMEAVPSFTYLRILASTDRTPIDSTHHVTGTTVQLHFGILYETP